MRYLIDDEEYTEEEFYKKLEDDVSVDVEDNYDDILDDIYEPYKIGEMEYPASMVLERCDPTAYRCGIADETSYALENRKDEIANGEEVRCNGSYYRIENQYRVRDIKTNEIVGDDMTSDEAEEFVENDQNDHALEIEDY